MTKRSPTRRTNRPELGRPSGDRRAPLALLLVVIVAVVLVVIAADFVFGSLWNTAGSAPTGSASTQPGMVVQGNGGHWTNIGPNQLADMLGHKDFTLLNVKTPYMGEIDGTDLYIPFDQLKARTAELPADKGARVLVYCRSGVQSAQAAQTLLDLGYTNVWNLDGGMNAWQASGRRLVNLNRT
ncbi:MAG: rhodanese-like domain-containing protein [Candidatus Limnocylindrales bacterium]